MTNAVDINSQRQALVQRLGILIGPGPTARCSNAGSGAVILDLYTPITARTGPRR